jgi:predicted dehydrogenase
VAGLKGLFYGIKRITTVHIFVMTKIKLIHVGLGRWGFDWAQHIYPGSSDVEPVAYVDNDPETLTRAQSRLGVSPSKFFPALGDAVAATDAEAVVVALPLPLHAELAREALLAGKHVIVEKPFTPTLEEAQSLVGIAEKSSRVLMVSQNYRFFAAPQAAHQFVRDAWFGQLHTVQVDFRLNAVTEGYGYRHQSLPAPYLPTWRFITSILCEWLSARSRSNSLVGHGFPAEAHIKCLLARWPF